MNPLGGCWPLFIQMPIFFALYKVLFITIEMRHAPFFGWIKDLSAPDPVYDHARCSGSSRGIRRPSSRSASGRA